MILFLFFFFLYYLPPPRGGGKKMERRVDSKGVHDGRIEHGFRRTHALLAASSDTSRYFTEMCGFSAGILRHLKIPDRQP